LIGGLIDARISEHQLDEAPLPWRKSEKSPKLPFTLINMLRASHIPRSVRKRVLSDYHTQRTKSAA
jgi:hypothetical protein